MIGMTIARKRLITGGLAWIIGTAFLTGYISIASVIGQPWTALAVFGYALFCGAVGVATGRESMKRCGNVF